MINPTFGFAWGSDGMLKLARATQSGIEIVADICPVTHQNVDLLIKSLQDLKENIKSVHQKLH